MDSLPVRVRILVAAVALAAATLLLYLTLRRPVDLGLACIFGIFVLIAEQFPVPLPVGVGSYSVGFVLMITAIIVGGAPEAGIASAFGFATLRELRRTHPARHLFNASTLALSSTAAGLAYEGVYRAVIGSSASSIEALFPRVFIPAFAATSVHFLTNTGLVALVISLVRDEPFSAVWREQFRPILAGSLAFATLGVVMAALYLEMGIGSVIFLLVPLLVARHAFQTALKMESAFDATVRSLIKAIEAKDAYTKGHAERVAKLAEMTAETYGLSSHDRRIIRYVALMHDVGKLGVSTKILAKPGKLTPEEYEHMKQHPLRGYEIVREIDFLREAAETAVRHHHERMDGQGYPDGLVGEQIPLLARIVMVCDAFDSMTSTRVYRKAKTVEEALAELRRCAGTQFDPKAFAALERAIERHGWEAEPESMQQEMLEHEAGAL
jgi:putative nucleotidyltransferase with HDIG domain